GSSECTTAPMTWSLTPNPAKYQPPRPSRDALGPSRQPRHTSRPITHSAPSRPLRVSDPRPADAAHSVSSSDVVSRQPRRCPMERRQFLRLGAVASGAFALGGISRFARGTGAAQAQGVPAVDRLVMTNVVDNVYDAFARGGKLDTITVQRAALDPKGLLLFEHGLAYHLESVRGGERREILLDFAATQG